VQAEHNTTGWAMDYIDPTKSSPDNYKVLYEDDDVRLLEMNLKAGE
jgi:hypothetical protein